MTYEEAVNYLYNATPQFQRIGAAAYKPGLDTVRRLAAAFGNPQEKYPAVHVGGTNGKGSTAHTLAAVFQSAGYKTGLYTSPHLVDFRERMRVNGEMIPREEVTRFVERYLASGVAEELSPSFFELTTVMAFDWFARCGVDVAVIEVGLGGRLDSTNIITPRLSVITNISLDHMAQLGNTKEAIAREKAGIIKRGVPLVCGEDDPAIRAIFAEKARETESEVTFAATEYEGLKFEREGDRLVIEGAPTGRLRFELTGECQKQNSRTIIGAIEALRRQGWELPADAVREGFDRVCDKTGLMGRWMTIGREPMTICDTGHNIGGWELLSGQLAGLPRPLTVVLGFVNDKDTSHIFPLLPRDARYIYTNAAIPRALPAEELAARGEAEGLEGETITPVSAAVEAARRQTPPEGAVFVGGSTFVVADLLAALQSGEL